jgi:hypothetical protein
MGCVGNCRGILFHGTVGYTVRGAWLYKQPPVLLKRKDVWTRGDNRDGSGALIKALVNSSPEHK